MSIISLLPNATYGISLFVALTCLWYIYTISLSPLRHIPVAHPLSRLSTIWIRYHRRGGSQALPAITRAHAKHGPIVLLSPSEISVSSYEGAHKIYIEKGGFAKPKWWAEEFTSYGVRNMVSLQGGVGSKEHAQRKRLMGNVYAKSYLMGSKKLKDIARQVLRGLEEALGTVVSSGGVMDVYNFNGGVNADFASRYIFGESGKTDFTHNQEERDGYFHNHSTWLKGKPGAAQAQAWLENFGFHRLGTAEKGAAVYDQLWSRGLRDKDLASELLDHFIAGAEAPRTNLTYLQWELSKQPEAQHSLQAEVYEFVSKMQSSGQVIDALVDFKAIDALPILDSMIMETLRLYTPTPGPQHRITPPEGTFIHDMHIPGGIHINSSLSILHHNAEVFPEPEKWKPERWITEDPAKKEEMRKWFWAFNKGSRICIGKDFTLIVMKVIVAMIYYNFSTEIVESGNMEQEDKFLAGPIGESLVLRFRKGLVEEHKIKSI